MHKLASIIGSYKLVLGTVALTVVVLIPVLTFAGKDEAADLQHEKELLLLRIEQSQKEYVIVAQKKAEAQEACNMVAAQETQLRRLNELNNSRRAEIKLIDQKLAGFQSRPR